MSECSLMRCSPSLPVASVHPSIRPIHTSGADFAAGWSEGELLGSRWVECAALGSGEGPHTGAGADQAQEKRKPCQGARGNGRSRKKRWRSQQFVVVTLNGFFDGDPSGAGCEGQNNIRQNRRRRGGSGGRQREEEEEEDIIGGSDSRRGSSGGSGGGSIDAGLRSPRRWPSRLGE